MSHDTAMIAKAKAKASKFLSMNDYQVMLGLRSVADIAAYLKNHPRYEKVLAGVNERSIHREYLEQRIRSQAQIDFNDLLKYMKTDSHHFYEFFIKELEMNHILFAAHAIDSNTKFHLGKFLMHLNHLMTFDVEALASVKTYDDLVEILASTEYKVVTAELEYDEPNLSLFEDQLFEYYNKTMFSLIEKEGNHQEILDLFRMKLELNDLAHAYRLLKYFKTEGDNIERRLNWTSYKISKRDMHQWLHSGDETELLQGIQSSYYGSIFTIEEDKHIEYSFSMILYLILKRKLRTSNDSDVILFSYMNLINIEIENIIDIVEGIRYEVPHEEILSLLII